MIETMSIPDAASKSELYAALLPQIEALIAVENDLIANLANIASALHYGMDFFWVGFYLVKGNELVLGPFQGTVACTRIGFGKGVCGKCWERKKIIVVPDVEKFEGHIACSSLSKSEIVLPIFKNADVVMVLDVDSNQINDFDETDKQNLQKIVECIEHKLY